MVSPSCAVWYDTSLRAPAAGGSTACMIVATSAMAAPSVSVERYFTCHARTGTGSVSARMVTGRESRTVPGATSGNGEGWA
ncbi:hypothetical protein AB0K15_11550 [Amycolatopsis sp. NPDC049253]|uniref:hypothetical protein n=1 Tax=Amycolatopsis sp. NPDC049253 TaxID=3155274 RepID=UPI00342E28A6